MYLLITIYFKVMKSQQLSGWTNNLIVPMLPWDVDSSTESTMRATLTSFPSSWENLLGKAKDGQLLNHLWCEPCKNNK